MSNIFIQCIFNKVGVLSTWESKIPNLPPDILWNVELVMAMIALPNQEVQPHVVLMQFQLIKIVVISMKEHHVILKAFY